MGIGTNGIRQKDFWEYDFITNLWTQRADFGGTARSSTISFAICNKAWVVTGQDPAFKKDLWEYCQ